MEEWQSSAGGERYWNQESSEWERSKWSTPTRRALKGSEYDTDQEWHLRSMRYGDGWAYDSTHSHYKRAKPTQTDPEDDGTADPSLPLGSTKDSTAAHRLGSIHEVESDAVKASSEKADHRWKHHVCHSCSVLESMCRLSVAVRHDAPREISRRCCKGPQS